MAIFYSGPLLTSSIYLYTSFYYGVDCDGNIIGKKIEIHYENENTEKEKNGRREVKYREEKSENIFFFFYEIISKYVHHY